MSSRPHPFFPLAVAGLLAILAAHLPLTQAANADDAEAISASSVEVDPLQGRTDFSFTLRNTGSVTWFREGKAADAVNLGTQNPSNGNSLFADATWHSKNRIVMNEDSVAPGEVGKFSFTASVPHRRSQVRQDFRLVREHVGWFGPTLTLTALPDPNAPVYQEPVDIPVIVVPGPPADQPPTPPLTGNGPKWVDVSLVTNTMTMYEGDVVVHSYKISPGKSSTPTPTGTFKVRGKADVAYSKAHKLWMPYWNAFTPDGAYGVHGLPYWKRGGHTVVEGAAHIGRNVSHGCIRLPPGADNEFYTWASVGTSIKIHR